MWWRWRAPSGVRVAAVEAPAEELRGVNSRAELAAAEAVVQGGCALRRWTAGVTMTEPDSVFLCADTQLAPDVTIGPNVVFGPGVTVAERRGDPRVQPSRGLRDRCRTASIGPFARLRPGTVVGDGAHVGNFVELKAATLGAGAKANHLTYLGDAEVGAGTNIGAGTITCNYDGFDKHRTDDRRRRVHRLEHRAGGAGDGRRRRDRRRPAA